MTRASDTARLLGAGATILDGTTISTADNTAQLELVSTDADSGIGPHQVFYRNSSSPADADLLCELDFRGRNDNSQDVDYATINVKATDVSDGTEDGQFILQTKQAGSTVDRMNLSSSETVFNEDSKDIDFRVESDSASKGLFLDATSGHLGIHAEPTTTSSVYKGVQTGLGGTLLGRSDDTPLYLSSNVTYTDNWKYIANTSGSQMALGTNIQFYTIASGSAGNTATLVERMRLLNSTGSLLINRTTNNSTASTAVDIDADEYIYCLVLLANGTNGAFVRLLANDGSTVGSIDHSGSTARYLTSSDYRLKENIVDMTDATTRLKELKPRRFNFIADADTTVDGFLAHEVSSIVPEAVNGEKDAMTEELLYVDGDEIPDGKKVGDVKEASKIDPQGIDQSKLVPLLVKTIQELEARITTLENA